MCMFTDVCVHSDVGLVFTDACVRSDVMLIRSDVVRFFHELVGSSSESVPKLLWSSFCVPCHARARNLTACVSQAYLDRDPAALAASTFALALIPLIPINPN